MNILLLQYPAIFIASLVSLTLVFFKVPIVNLQQIIAFFLVVLLLSISRFFIKSKTAALKKLFLIFVSTLLVQLVVIATGGFFSPLFILIHLYTLGSSFLLNLSSSIVFLVSSLTVLGLQVYLYQEFRLKAVEDPGTTSLYLLSLIIIIPLSQFLTSTYNLKDRLTKLLGDYLFIGKGRESFILSGLNELVVITNKELQIISISEAVAKTLKISSDEVLNKPVFSMIPIKDDQGRQINPQNLPMKELTEDKATRIIRGFNLLINREFLPVVIQVKPIVDSQMRISQLVFIITDARLYGDIEQTHFGLEQTLIKHKDLIADIKKMISQTGASKVKRTVAALDHTEEDLRIALEIEDHPIKQKLSLDDIAYLSQQAFESRKSFAEDFGVSLEFNIPQTEVAEGAWLKLKKQNIDPRIPGKSDFAIPVDSRWFKLLVQKLLDLGILLSSDNNLPKVELSINKSKDHLGVLVVVYCTGVTESEKDNLFIKHFGRLTNLPGLVLSSGLEGFIAQSISTSLGILLSVQIQENPHRLVLSLKMNIVNEYSLS